MSTTTDSLPMLLSLEQVGRQLGIKLPTVKKRVASGVIPSVKEGGCRKVRRVDLEAYVESLPTAQPTKNDAA